MGDRGAGSLAHGTSPAGTFVVGHCETTSGIINPIDDIVSVCKEMGKTVMVDAMSSFGAVPLDMDASGMDVMVSSSNKCIEGVPGFGFVIAQKDEITAVHSFPSSPI